MALWSWSCGHPALIWQHGASFAQEVWGSHLHTGFYYTGKESDHVKAQVGRTKSPLLVSMVVGS
jgi:hypothetical protein